MEHRTLGRTGRRLSLIGFGGVVLNHMDQAFADALVGEAFDLGIDYFDISPAYGTAQGLLGPALEPYRKHVFLACKADKRTKAEAAAQLRESLGVMHTDYFDLYQLHGVTSREEIETILGPGGALEALIEAKGKGLVRHLGFSAHTEEAALALMAAFDFDSILFPVNFAAWYGGNFGPRVLSMAEKKGLGILAIKALAKRRLNEGEERHKRNCWYAPVENEEEAELALRFTLSRPVAAAVSPGDAELMRWACKFAERFRPLQAEEELELERKARGLAPVFPVPG